MDDVYPNIEKIKMLLHFMLVHFELVTQNLAEINLSIIPVVKSEVLHYDKDIGN